MTVIIAGTFSVLHKGHKELFSAAVNSGKKLIVGLTTNEFISANKNYKGIDFETRKKKLRQYLDTLGIKFEIKPLDNSTGNSASSKEYDTIVVSPESYGNAVLINKTRVKNGILPMKIILVPFALGNDFFPVKSSRILSGEIDENGKRLTEIKISVPTSNRFKEEAVKDFFGKTMPGSSVRMHSSYDIPSDQPFGDDTFAFAKKRAEEAIEGNDYSVSLESGLFPVDNGEYYLDIHHCCILDKFGKLTVGTSSGFSIPNHVVREIKKGNDLGKAFVNIYGNDSIYSENGIAGIISNGTLNRKYLFMEAVRNAFLPRIRPDYYLR